MLYSKTRLVLHFPYDKVRMLPLILSVLFMIPAWVTAETPNDLPFNVGDHFYYDIKWGIFKVGEAEMLVEDADEKFPGDLKFVLLVRTTSWADAFYRVRNRIESRTNATVTKSLHYTKSQHEGSRKREIVVNFDWEKKQAQYSNFDEKLEPISISDNCHDPFSVLFAYRLRDFVLGDHIVIPITDGKKCLDTDIAVMERENIKVKAGRFDCLRVRPDVKDLGGIFSKSKNASMDIWFSDDKNKLIVKMSSSVSIGKFRVELREYVLGDSI
ncbi:MAG: DUF3108 domain-containing protein [Verrucomicrobia bacterium]|nr:DUF3108 domain-containing protein [Verrucomicrobiota bacterium]